MLIGLWSQPVLAGPAPRPTTPRNAQARKHYERAVELLKAGDHEGAAKEAEAAFEIEKHDFTLYVWSQAERQLDNCVRSVELSNEVIRMTKDEGLADYATESNAWCANRLADIAREAEEEAEAAAAAEEELEAEPEPETPPPPPIQPWYRDPVGGVLVGVGGLGVLGGGALLVTAAILDPTKAADYGTFDERRALQPKLLLAGGITAGVGVAIGTAGAVRWALVARKNKRLEQERATQARIQLVPWIDGRRAGVVFSGRF